MATQEAATTGKKVWVAILMLVVAAGIAYSQMKKVTPSAAVNNGVTSEFGGRGPGGPGGDDKSREERMTAMRKEVGITAEQEKQIEAVRDKIRESGDWSQMREEMNKILTPEQQKKMEAQREKMRGQFQAARAEREAKMKSAMSDEEFKRYQERREQRRAQRGGNRGGGSAGAPQAPTRSESPSQSSTEGAA